MTEKSNNALKHGAFSEVVILPGEDPQDFEKLKTELFEEYKPSGVSEERLIVALAKALWQQRRLAVYQHIQYARAGQDKTRRGSDSMTKFIAKYLPRETTGAESPPAKPPESAEERVNKELLEFGDLLTLDQLGKELDVETKLQAKIDRLLKQYFQIKAMKQIAGLTASTPAALNGPAPVLELTAQEPT
jgi:hypothetical protein